MFTSSPEGFYYISQGYFDKEEIDNLILRKVAQAASCGFMKEEGFEAWWPLPEELQKETPSWATTAKETRDRLLKQFTKG